MARKYVIFMSNSLRGLADRSKEGTALDHYGLLDTAAPGLTRFDNHFVKDVVDVAL
jgi:hypothetical protein